MPNRCQILRLLYVFQMNREQDNLGFYRARARTSPGQIGTRPGDLGCMLTGEGEAGQGGQGGAGQGRARQGRAGQGGGAGQEVRLRGKGPGDRGCMDLILKSRQEPHM